MAVSSFLSKPYRYFKRVGVTDVATIIADLATELVANGWTDTSGAGAGPFTSPAQAGDGSFMSLKLTSVASTQLKFEAFDHVSLLINNQTSNKLYIDAGGSVIEYFTGPEHVFVNATRATPECFGLCRLDQYPHIDGEVRANFVVTRGPRNDAGTLGYQTLQDWFILPLYGTSYNNSMDVALKYCGTNPSRTTLAAGKNVCAPAAVNDTTNKVWLGIIPQAMLIPSTTAFGTVVTVPIDVGLTGDFSVVGLTTSYGYRLGIRKA